MTTFYLDTEFNGFGGKLISLALVTPGYNEPYFYEICEILEHPDPWVLQNVIPVLGPKIPLRERLFRLAFQQFIIQFDNPTIICDWHADAVHFAQLLAGHNIGTSLDFACTIKILKTPPGQPVSEQPHNALADATALMKWHQQELNK